VGNKVLLRVNGHWSGPLDYTQNCDGTRPATVGGYFAMGDAEYITCKLPISSWRKYDKSFANAWVMIASSAEGMIDGISTIGNLGADEGGKQEYNNGGDELTAPGGVVGYYKKTYGADAPGVSLADPSVNHLIWGRGISGASVTIGSTTDSDLHEVVFPHGTTLVYYIMWAGEEGQNYPRADIEMLLHDLAASCTGNLDDETGSAAGQSTGHSGGGNGGATVAIVIVVLLVLALVGGAGYAVSTGKLSLSSITSVLPGRSRTSPSSTSTVGSLGAPPLQTPRAGLVGADSAADNFATAYTPPPSSGTM